MPTYNVMALNAATQGTAAAGSRGLDVPASLRAADQLVLELRRLALPQPEPPLPNLAGVSLPKLRDILAAAAKDRIERTALVQMAEDYIGPALANYIAEYRSVWASWLPPLAKEFTRLIAEFTDALPDAPLGVGPSTTDEQVTAYMRTVRAATALESLVADRSLLGSTVAEEGHGLRSLLLVATVPTPPTTVEQFTAAWPAVHDMYHDYATIPAGVDRWRALTGSLFTPSLALAGDIERRRSDYSRWTYLNGELHTYGGTAKFLAEVSQRSAPAASAPR